MQVQVHPAKCVASGQCVMAAPDVFDQDDDGIVILLDAEPGADVQPDSRTAAELCPARAITLLE